ncbi:MAG: 30S ribosomal protein S20 [Verrucomicrobia bacterium]|nr:30S ribosomal protein S20 [Verrucomicrobiota bacterium]MBV9658544.1 30S ribosomal protein S20 [Verrucomicrobiota bacterium]
MANTKSAAKRARQTVTRTLRNRRVLTGIKSHTKSLRTQLAGKDSAAAKAAYQALVSELDRAAKRGVIHKNAADRRKGTLARALVALGSK